MFNVCYVQLLLVLLTLQFLDTTTITSSIYTHPSPSETDKSSEDSGRKGSITYLTTHTLYLCMSNT